MTSAIFEAFGNLRSAVNQEAADAALSSLVRAISEISKDGDTASVDYVVQRLVRGLCSDQAAARINFLSALKVACTRNKRIFQSLANLLSTFDEFVLKQLEPHSKRQKTNADLAYILSVTLLFEAIESGECEALSSKLLGKLVATLRETMRRAQLCALGLHALVCLMRSSCEPCAELTHLITQSATSGWQKASETNMTVLLAALAYRPAELQGVLNSKDDSSQSLMDTDDDGAASRIRKRFLKKFWHVDALLHHSNATHVSKLLAEARNEYPAKRDVPHLLLQHTMKYEPSSLAFLFDCADKNVKHVQVHSKKRVKKEKRSQKDGESETVQKISLKDVCFVTELVTLATSLMREENLTGEQLVSTFSVLFTPGRIALASQVPDNVPLRAKYLAEVKQSLQWALALNETGQKRLSAQLLSNLVAAFGSQSCSLSHDLLSWLARQDAISAAEWCDVLQRTFELSNGGQQRSMMRVWCTLLSQTTALSQFSADLHKNHLKTLRSCLTTLFSEAFQDSLRPETSSDSDKETVVQQTGNVNVSQLAAILKRLLWQSDKQARSVALQLVFGSLCDAVKSLDEKSVEAKRLRKVLKKVKASNANETDAETFSLTLVASFMSLLDRQDEESRDELLEILSDIQTANERFSAESSSKAPSSDDEPHWRVVLMECVLGLLSNASFFVRELLMRAVEATQWSDTSVALVRDAIFNARLTDKSKSADDSDDDVHSHDGDANGDVDSDAEDDVQMNDAELVDEFKKRVALLGEAAKQRVEDKKERKLEATKLLHFRLRCVDLLGALLIGAIGTPQAQVHDAVVNVLFELMQQVRQVNRNADESSQMLSALARTLTDVHNRVLKDKKQQTVQCASSSLLTRLVTLSCANATYKVSDACVRPLQRALVTLGRLLIEQLHHGKASEKSNAQKLLVASVQSELRKANFGVQMTHTVAQLVRADRLFWLPLTSGLCELLDSGVQKAYERTQLLRLLRSFFLDGQLDEQHVRDLLTAAACCGETAVRGLTANNQTDAQQSLQVEFVVATFDLLTEIARFRQSTLKRFKSSQLNDAPKVDFHATLATVESWKKARFGDGAVTNAAVKKAYNSCLRCLRAAAADRQAVAAAPASAPEADRKTRKTPKGDSAKRRKLN